MKEEHRCQLLDIALATVVDAVIGTDAHDHITCFNPAAESMTGWRSSEALGKGELPAGGKPNVLLRVDYADGSKGVGWLEIARAETSSGVSEDAAATGDLYARTEHTASWVKIPAGTQIVPDAQKLLAAP